MKSIPDEQREIQVEHLDDKREERFLSSSRGDKKIKFSSKECKSEGQCFSLLSLEISGEFYDRSVGIKAAEIVRDYDVRLPQIRVQRDFLPKLDDAFKAWLERGVGFECRLSLESYRDQFLLIALGENEGLIASPGKSAVTLEYRCGPSLSLSASFLIDQSCARLWLGQD